MDLESHHGCETPFRGAREDHARGAREDHAHLPCLALCVRGIPSKRDFLTGVLLFGRRTMSSDSRTRSPRTRPRQQACRKTRPRQRRGTGAERWLRAWLRASGHPGQRVRRSELIQYPLSLSAKHTRIGPTQHITHFHAGAQYTGACATAPGRRETSLTWRPY